MKLYKIVIFALLMVACNAHAQDMMLSKQSAVDIALENNYDIRIAEGNVESAENSAKILNTGFLPTISASGGVNYNVNDNNVEFQDGREQAVSGAQTYSINGGLDINYTVFDGLGRKYNYAMLKENYNLSELQARQVIENSIVNIFAIYYDVARLTQNVNSQVETIDISRTRLRRAKFGYEYGQNTQLDVLNAEVDYNNDSITYRNLNLELKNVKRDLNVLLGREVAVDFSVDTTITYMKGLSLEELMSGAMANNVSILQNEGLLRNTEYDVKVSKSSLIPRLGLRASYSYNERFNDPTSFLKYQNSRGPTFNASLSWNIFDGGASNVRVQNSLIAAKNQQIALKQNRQILERNVKNAWAFYQNALFVLEAERKNLLTNQRNFDRTLDQQKLGQITSIEFRQAQLNLLNAQLNFNQAKYSAKTAELALVQISGDLMYAEF